MSNEKADRVRVSVMVDGDLWTKAKHLAESSEPAHLVHEALMTLIQRESARRLALLGGERFKLPKQTPDQRLSEIAREVQRACEEARLLLADSLSGVRQVLEELRGAKEDREGR